MGRPRHNEDAAQFTMSFVADVVPLGDGSYKIIPGRPRAKLTVREAAKVAGVPVGRIYELYHCGMLDAERPTPRKILIFADSLERHLKASRDPEHWSAERRQQFTGKI